jgi:hypothetical protein
MKIKIISKKQQIKEAIDPISMILAFIAGLILGGLSLATMVLGRKNAAVYSRTMKNIERSVEESTAKIKETDPAKAAELSKVIAEGFKASIDDQFRAIAARNPTIAKNSRTAEAAKPRQADDTSDETSPSAPTTSPAPKTPSPVPAGSSRIAIALTADQDGNASTTKATNEQIKVAEDNKAIKIAGVDPIAMPAPGEVVIVVPSPEASSELQKAIAEASNIAEPPLEAPSTETLQANGATVSVDTAITLMQTAPEAAASILPADSNSVEVAKKTIDAKKSINTNNVTYEDIVANGKIDDFIKVANDNRGVLPSELGKILHKFLQIFTETDKKSVRLDKGYNNYNLQSIVDNYTAVVNKINEIQDTLNKSNISNEAKNLLTNLSYVYLNADVYYQANLTDADNNPSGNKVNSRSYLLSYFEQKGVSRTSQDKVFRTKFIE